MAVNNNRKIKRKVRNAYIISTVSIALVLFAILGGIGGTYEGGAIEALSNPVSLVMLIPVVVMLVVATKSRNIFLGILVGLSLGLVTGLACGLFPPSAVFANDPENSAATGFLVTGVAGMLGTVGLVISVFGIMGVLTDAGMLGYLVEKILGSKLARTPRGAEVASVIGISLTTLIFGGVTSASILTFGPVLNEVGKAKGIHPYRRANLLDAVANSLPAIVPFLSVFVFIGSALTGLSPVAVAGGTLYGFTLFAVMVVAVATGWGRDFEGKNGEAVKLLAIDMPDKTFANFLEPLEAAMEHEKYVTSLINDIYAAALEAHDYRAQKFLGWFIDEQLEEEDNADTMITNMKLFGGDPKGLYDLDQACAARVYTVPSPLAGK